MSDCLLVRQNTIAHNGNGFDCAEVPSLLLFQAMITTKLFIGCQIKPDLRIRLNQSFAWKQAQLHTEGENEPAEFRFKQKDYLGFFLPSNSGYLTDIRARASHIRKAVKSYCNDYPEDQLKFYVFPQIFVS